MPTFLRRLWRWEMPENLTAFDGDSEKALAAKTLHSVLRYTLCFGVLYLALVVPLFAARKTASTASWVVIIAVILACIFFLRRDRVRLSSWVFLSIAWLMLASLVVLSGGIRSPALLSHIPVIVMSAWLVGRRAAIRIAALSLAFIMGLAILEIVGVYLPRYYPMPPVVLWVIAVILVIVAILPLASASQALADSARQARRELEARRHEEQIRAESVERFQATFFQAAVGIAHISLTGEWILVNDRYAQMLGYTVAELRRMTLREITHPDDFDVVLDGRRRLLAGEISSHTMDKRYIRKDGSIFWASLYRSLVRDEENRPKYLIGVVEDITERKQAEAGLRESEERLKRAERLAHVGHWCRDLKSGQVIWSEECSRIFGLPRGYVPSKEELLRMVVPQDRELIARHGLTAKSGNSIEYRIARSDGELRTLTAIFEVFPDEEGSPARVFGAVRDITDERRAQEENVARQKLESVGTLANGIAHDFNNLLGGVVAQSELALSEVAAGVNPVEELRAIREVAIRGSEIVRELMIYAGKETAAVGLVDVSQIVKEMLELFKVSVSKHAVLETNLGQGCPGVRANAAQLRRIVMNLVTNASDALGDRDGVIRVTTSCVNVGQKPLVGISGRLADGDYLELEVSDTGCGISQETQAKMFDPFFTTKSAGHGLGLAIVDGIVRSLGATMHLSSEPGKGTTFLVWLPCGETSAGATRDAMSGIEELPRPPQEATVLVVEDEAPLRQAVTKMLGKSGFEVLEAADGTSAIDLVRANRGKIDVILLDATIPGASSAEVAAEAAKAEPAMKVILTSAYSQEMLAPPMNESEVRGFIRKPFQLRDLVETLRDAVAV